MNDQAFVPLAELQTVIDQAGDYVTRDGRKVTIFTVSTGSETFAAKGAIHREYRGKMVAKDRNIWHVSGRCYPVLPSPDDIVGKFE